MTKRLLSIFALFAMVFSFAWAANAQETGINGITGIYVTREGETVATITQKLQDLGITDPKISELNGDLAPSMVFHDGDKIAYFIPGNLASSKDIQDLQKAMQENVANGLKALTDQNEKNAEEAAGRLAQLANKQRVDQEAMMTALKQNEERSHERFIHIVEVAGGLFTVGVFLFVWRTRKGQNTNIVANTKQAQANENSFERIVNPDIMTLRRLRTETGKMRFPITIIPEAKGFTPKPPVDCEAAFLDDRPRPVVYFPGENAPVSWEQSVKHAAKFTARSGAVLN